jgi:hypothetical protein
MKEGLNRMDIAKYHKWLAQEVPPKAIARKLHTTVEVLERLNPKAWEKGEKKRAAREKEVQQERVANRRKADILVETAAKVMSSDPAFPPL